MNLELTPYLSGIGIWIIAQFWIYISNKAQNNDICAHYLPKTVQRFAFKKQILNIIFNWYFVAIYRIFLCFIYIFVAKFVVVNGNLGQVPLVFTFKTMLQ